MPLQKLQFKPGINREQTSLTGEGGWFECDKIRFRSGMPQKIGGWTKDPGITSSALQPPTGSYWGVARSLWNWVTLAGSNLLAIGTNLKYYIQSSAGGYFHDVTPIRAVTAAGDVTFTATNGSKTIVVSDTAHNCQTGDFVTFSGAVGLGGNITAGILNAEFQVTYISSSTYSIQSSVAANASDTGHGGTATVGTYQISVGSDIYTTGIGWGAGGWGGSTPPSAVTTGWGSPAPAGVGVGIQLRLWSQSNYGQDLIFNPRGGGLYYWAVNANPNIYDRGGLLSSSSAGIYQTDVDCPTVCNIVTVSDIARIVVAFGVNDYGSSVQDPMLVRWSSQEDYTSWTPTATNQAGSYRLSHGSGIVAANQTRQEILVWTDSALYSMQYLGPPYVWTTQILADNISMMSQNAAVTVNSVTYWMGTDKFYVYSGRTEALPCSLWGYVFGDFNLEQAGQVQCGSTERYHEVWWFYCSSNSTVLDRYVIYNYLEKIWYYGNMSRTTWFDSSVRPFPLATGYGGTLYNHEASIDDGSTNPPSAISAYIQSSDFDIGDGHNYGFVWRTVPDITFDGSTAMAPEVTMTLKPRQNPGSAYGATNSPSVVSTNDYATQRNYLVQQFTEIIYTRVRGRQMAFRIASDTVGTQWQLGTPRIDARPDGRR